MAMWVHCILAFSIRLLLIAYGEVQDKVSLVKYTDIDYKVFTDAARLVYNGTSPFDQPTYRYTPLLAMILTPNIFFHPAWGKFLFSLFDIFVGMFIYNLVLLKLCNKNAAKKCSFFWLYNPLSVIISTRGNSDSLSAFLVLLTLYLFQKEFNYILVGFFHALSIHIRIYPIIFSLAMYLSLNVYRYDPKNRKASNLYKLLKPNWKQIQLTVSCLVTLILIYTIFFYFYGTKFLDESLLYHLKRSDIRHNFSLYFYLQYLSCMFSAIPLWQSLIINLPKIVLLVVFSFLYGTRKHLEFCLLCMSIIFVAYNSVLTAQYFVWVLSLLPLCLPQLEFTRQQLLTVAAIWVSSLVSWLLPAYLLEFKGKNTFMYIWIQGIAFFCANMALLARVVRSYKGHYFKQR